MIDIHCHILPEVDDGADCLQTALMMAAMAADDGVETIVATPHVTWENGTSLTRLKHIADAANALQEKLRQEGIPVQILTGAEVLCADVEADLPMEEFPRLAGTDYTLVEFFFDESLQRIDTTLNNLLRAGLKPIVAHPERYDCVQRDKSMLTAWRGRGVLLQMNQGSPLGIFGRRTKKIAEWMLKNKLADFMATDAHGIRTRNTQMAEIRNQLARRYGETYLDELTEINPRKLLQGDKCGRITYSV